MNISILPDVNEAVNIENAHSDLVTFSVVSTADQDLEETAGTFIHELDNILDSNESEPEIEAKKSILLSK